jgi:hypothetical protein
MRDLKADSEQIQNFRCKWRQSTSLEEAWDIGVAWECFCREKAELWEELWLDQALAEKERADKAEALARELVEALKHIERLAELARRRSRYPGAVMSYGAEIRLAVEGALEKAKEVLGDGE